MSIFTGLFKSREKPQNRTTGSSYTFGDSAEMQKAIEKIPD